MNENESVQNADIQDTIPEDVQQTETDTEGAENDFATPENNTLPPEDVTRDTEADTAQDSVSEQIDNTEPFISVQYNHKNVDFSKDEAVRFIQKGMHTEGLRKKLDYIATLRGTDVNTLVEKIVTAPEKAYRHHLENLFGVGSEDVEIGMKIYREKQSDEYKEILAERENSIAQKEQSEKQSVYSRLADEYIMLKSEMPDAPEYNALPDSVIIEAAEGKRDLYSAYLRYLHKEKTKIDAAKKVKDAATAASTGTMKSGGEDNISSTDRNFLSGLWGR